MATNIYVGNANNQAKKVKYIYIGDASGKARKVLKGYVGDSNGNARLFYSAFLPPSSHTPGDIITWDNKEWLVCHYDSSSNCVYLILKDIYSLTVFDSTPPTSYPGTILYHQAEDFLIDELSNEALEMCKRVTVSGATLEVFVPSSEQMSGGFSWFNSNAHRIANYNGVATPYWISTVAPPNNFLGSVTTSGSIYSPTNYNQNYGFRPCICVQL